MVHCCLSCFLFYFVLNNDNPEPIFKAIWIPLHIGVPLFVLVSGFFKIRLSIHGLLRIVANLFVYGLAYTMIYLIMADGHIGWKNFCFISNTGAWFVRTYLILYLLSPIINRFLSASNSSVRLLVLCILGYLSLWIGWNGFDKTMDEGYDILNFMFFYMLGNILSEYKNQLAKIPTWAVFCAWLTFNIVFVKGVASGALSGFLFHFAFPYNSPGIVINAVLFFIIFMRMSFQSKVVNYMASSSLAIYLIHSGSLVFKTLVKGGALVIQEVVRNWAGQMALVFAFSLGIIILCIAIDKVHTPLWNLTNRMADKLAYTRLGKVMEAYSYR